MINYNNDKKQLTLSGYASFEEVTIKVNSSEYQSTLQHGECILTNIDIPSGSTIELTLIHKEYESQEIVYEF